MRSDQSIFLANLADIPRAAAVRGAGNSPRARAAYPEDRERSRKPRLGYR